MRAIALTTLLFACDPGSATPTDLPPPVRDTQDTAVEEEDELEDWQLTGQYGSIVARWAGPLPKGNPTYQIAAVFADDLQAGTAAGLCVDSGWCLPELPAPGKHVDVQMVWEDDASLTQWNGFELEIGDDDIPFVVDAERGRTWYRGPGTVPPDRNPVVSFDGEWGRYEGLAYELLSPMIITQPDASKTLPRTSPVPFRWAPGGEGQVVLRLEHGEHKRLYVLEDDGAYDLDLSMLTLDPELRMDLHFGRWHVTELDVNGNHLQIVSAVEQPFRSEK